MTDRPVIFSGPMIRALLREAERPGTGKTMTRRLLYSERRGKENESGVPVIPASATILEHHRPPFPRFGYYYTLTPWHRVQAGDRLWTRENVRMISQGPGPQVGINYAAEGEMGNVHFFSPSGHNLKRIGITPCIHQPRWASRLTLIVTGTKIERLQAITEDDAIAEGWPYKVADRSPLRAQSENRPTFWFAGLWINLHGSESWAANPEVVALTFRVIAKNIDKLDKAA